VHKLRIDAVVKFKEIFTFSINEDSVSITLNDYDSRDYLQFIEDEHIDQLSDQLHSFIQSSLEKITINVDSRQVANGIEIFPSQTFNKCNTMHWLIEILEFIIKSLSNELDLNILLIQKSFKRKLIPMVVQCVIERDLASLLPLSLDEIDDFKLSLKADCDEFEERLRKLCLLESSQEPLNAYLENSFRKLLQSKIDNLLDCTKKLAFIESNKTMRIECEGALLQFPSCQINEEILQFEHLIDFVLLQIDNNTEEVYHSFNFRSVIFRETLQDLFDVFCAKFTLSSCSKISKNIPTYKLMVQHNDCMYMARMCQKIAFVDKLQGMVELTYKFRTIGKDQFLTAVVFLCLTRIFKNYYWMIFLKILEYSEPMTIKYLLT
jgi:hypothetical protein